MIARPPLRACLITSSARSDDGDQAIRYDESAAPAASCSAVRGPGPKFSLRCPEDGSQGPLNGSVGLEGGVFKVKIDG